MIRALQSRFSLEFIRGLTLYESCKSGKLGEYKQIKIDSNRYLHVNVHKRELSTLFEASARVAEITKAEILPGKRFSADASADELKSWAVALC